MRRKTSKGAKAPSKSGKGRGRNSVPGSRNTREERSENTSTFDNGSNDPVWYMHNPPLVRDTAMLPFSNPVGKPLNVSTTVDLRHDGGTYVSTGLGNTAIQPGVLAMEVVPSIGQSNSKGSPVNIAAQKIYANVRRNKSGTLPYDASDLMMYILSMDQLYSFHEWMRRIYGYMNTFSSQNMYVPKAFAVNDGIDFQDMLSHMTDFRFYINNFALRLSTYLVPQDFDLFKRHAFMYSNIYMDAPVMKAQYYQFVPAMFLKFSETDSEEGTCLTMKRIDHNSPSMLTFDDIKNMGEELLNAIIYSEDANTMSGDILRGYDNSAVWKPADTPENYSCIPVYNPEVLGQIHNASNTGSLKYEQHYGAESYIYQDVDQGIIKCEIWRKLGAMRRQLIDTMSDAPTPAEIMVNTRLLTAADAGISKTVGGKTYYGLVHGSEIIVNMWITILNTNGSTFGRSIIPNDGDIIYGTPTSIIEFASWSSRLTKFNAHPIKYLGVTEKADAAAVTGAGDIKFALFGDINNVAVMDYTNLADLHLVAITSLFGI